jgi:hypothetical protein
MKSIYFSNKKSLQIISNDIKNDIKKNISSIGSFNLMSKYYTFLNKKNVNNLKENNFLISLSTFGKKFILFITRYNNKKYCIFINKKNDSMVVTQLKFIDDIFIGTLFDGELVKNSDDKWIYLINDIAYYKGNNIITKSFLERQDIIDIILQNEYENDSQSFYISKKNYFEYKNIKDLVENYSKVLNYKCSGLYFKSILNFSDNYLFIFPECRSDSKILKNGITVDNKNNDDDESSLFNVETNNIDDIYSVSNTSSINLSSLNSNSIHSNSKNNLKLEKTTCKFLINTTQMPDIYELYCKNSYNNIEKYSYASVPDLDTSNFIKNIFDVNYDYSEDIDSKINNNRAIYVECNYHKAFKKWIPYKKVDSMDNVNNINQTQIILDSM